MGTTQAGLPLSSSIQGTERVWPDEAWERGLPRPLTEREKMGRARLVKAAQGLTGFL